MVGAFLATPSLHVFSRCERNKITSAFAEFYFLEESIGLFSR